MWTRPKLDLWLSIVALMLVPRFALGVGENLTDPDAQVQSLVEIEYPPEVLVPYKERRKDWSPLFGFRYESLVASSYRSPDTNTYENLFGTAGAGLVGMQVGMKYNMAFGSLSAELSYSQGSVSDGRIGTDVRLAMTKTAAHFGLWLDTILSEPYVVPYIELQTFRLDFNETDALLPERRSSEYLNTGYAAGLLVQLNWLDPDASFRALVESGLNNAFLDFFLAQSDVSDLSWGAGFRLEY